jgi:hypothetical protein
MEAMEGYGAESRRKDGRQGRGSARRYSGVGCPSAAMGGCGEELLGKATIMAGRVNTAGAELVLRARWEWGSPSSAFLLRQTPAALHPHHSKPRGDHRCYNASL